MIKLALILTLLTNIAYAEEGVYLEKDKPAPYTGYLLPKDKLVELRNNTWERDTLKVQNDSLNRSLKLQDDIIAKKDDQLKLYSDQNDKLAVTVSRAESMNSWEKIGFIGLGVLLTSLAISGVHALYH